MTDQHKTRRRLLACCRLSVREAEMLPLWLAHYGTQADIMAVLVLAAPDDDLSGILSTCAQAGAQCRVEEMEIFDANAAMLALQGMVAGHPADWVVHADSDELLSELAEIRSLIVQMEAEGADHAIAWMADRLAPGGRLAGMEGIATVAELEDAFPVRAGVTQHLAKGTSTKVCLSRWPATGWMHQSEESQKNRATRRLTLEHFKWRTGLEERLRRRIRDHIATGVRWAEESRRILKELDTHGRIRAENWLAPRSRRLHGWMDYEDIYREAVLAAPDGAHFVEVGVWQGRSLCYLAEVMLACGKQLRLDGIDPFRNFPGGKTGYPAELRPLVTGHSWLDVVSANLRRQGMLDYVNLIQAASPAAAGLYADGSLDFVWIDGAHDRASVEADCRAWWPKLRRGGTLAGHDYQQAGVREGLKDACLADGQVEARGGSFVALKTWPALLPEPKPAPGGKGRGTVCLAMASDAHGFAQNATVIASVMRHTDRPVHVRMWLRRMTAESFKCGRLQVDFLPSERGLSGQVPQHVSQSTFDRLLVLRDCPDWSRALILDYDQLVLRDAGELFDMAMDGQILAGRLWHQTLGKAAWEWFGRKLPEKWRHCEGYPFFYMGPLLDLTAARAAGLWEKLVAFHREAQMEEQIALTVACAGRIKGLPACWNQVPKWDADAGPGGILHFTGPEKPWSNPALHCAGLWREQATTWEELKAGAGSLRPPSSAAPGRRVNAA